MSSLTDLINLDLSNSSGKIIAEYGWLGGSGMELRSKARTLSGPIMNPGEFLAWSYDGSSTGQATGADDSEVVLQPQAVFKDPFRRGNNILVMCDTYLPNGEPISSNSRFNVFKNPTVIAEEPWFGIEQEYYLLQKDHKWPIGSPAGFSPGPQGPYYCGVGTNKVFGHDIVDAYYKACLYTGINITGINAEVAGVVISYDPEPIQGEWNGSGAHTNFSTKTMRANGGYEVIKKAMEKLRLRHKEHIAVYGEGNKKRLSGQHETADYRTFAWGVGNREASIRVGRDTEKAGRGYFEDRRPASNMDPYVDTSMIAETTILWEPKQGLSKCIQVLELCCYDDNSTG